MASLARALAYALLLSALPAASALGPGGIGIIVDTGIARSIEGCYTVGQEGGDRYELVCYYQGDDKVCAGPDEVFHGCGPVPGAGQSAVACAFWLLSDGQGYAFGQLSDPGVRVPPVPEECV